MEPNTESTLTKPLILIVEDDPDMQAMLRLVVGRGGIWELIVAGDGVEAVLLASSRLPNLIVMDLNLPLLDGFEATRQIRSQVATHEIPIIAISNYFWHADWKRQALDAGCVECVDKAQLYGDLPGRISHLLPSGPN